jgi:PPOX class probable F420-dependent enzyme
MTALPELARELIDGHNFASVATIQPDGSPQSSIVWVRRDGDDVLFSTVKGRRKYANLLADPRVSLLVTDLANPYRYAEIRGWATVADDPRTELIQELAYKYTGQAFPARPGEERVIFRIAPNRVVVYDD